jgi:hypothetical protein
MQLHGGPQLDLSAQVAMVRAKTRPWKSIIALVLAIGAAVTSGWAHSPFQHFFETDDVVHEIVAAATAVAFLVFASAATIGLSGKAGSILEPVMGASHAAVVRYALVLIGAVTTLVVTLGLFGVPITQLLLGGALTSVFVGIAAQQALSNVFAGLVLLLAHPFKVGDSIRLRAGAMSGEIGGTVNEIGITYLKLGTLDGVLSIPNSLVLGAIVGPLPPGTRLPAPAPPAPATATASGLMAGTPPGTISPPLTAGPAVSVPPAAAGPPDGGPAGHAGNAHAGNGNAADGTHRAGASREQ